MHTIEFPKTVQDALGPQAAHDLQAWLEQRLALNESLVISAAVARRKANVVTLERVSNLLLADEPTLVSESGKWLWRVPVDLTFPKRGRVGRVGELEVDAQNGQVYLDDTKLESMRAKADQIAKQVLDN
ncbi:MAG: hypothetical protein HY741_01940 [Chloroflexi bacterium]|nr:hypothetical protein [Chloroflexota bacterium]